MQIGPHKLSQIKKYGVENGVIKYPIPVAQDHEDDETEKNAEDDETMKNEKQMIRKFFATIKESSSKIEHDPSKKGFYLLPFYISQKHHLYEKDFTEYVKDIQKATLLPSVNYFLRIWHREFRDVKILRDNFMMCNVCDKYEVIIQKTKENLKKSKNDAQKEQLSKKLAEIKKNLKKHTDMAEAGRKMMKNEVDAALSVVGEHLVMNASASIYLPKKKSDPQIFSMGKKFEVGLFGIINHHYGEAVNYLIPETTNSKKRSFPFFCLFFQFLIIC